jgi:hypothetical protein
MHGEWPGVTQGIARGSDSVNLGTAHQPPKTMLRWQLKNRTMALLNM